MIVGVGWIESSTCCEFELQPNKETTMVEVFIAPLNLWNDMEKPYFETLSIATKDLAGTPVCDMHPQNFLNPALNKEGVAPSSWSAPTSTVAKVLTDGIWARRPQR
jgi:hypothetical protein